MDPRFPRRCCWAYLFDGACRKENKCSGNVVAAMVSAKGKNTKTGIEAGNIEHPSPLLPRHSAITKSRALRTHDPPRTGTQLQLRLVCRMKL